MTEKDFFSPAIQQFLKNPEKSVSLLTSPSLSEKTEHSDQRTPATPATPVTPSEVTVGKIPKSRKQLEMEPFVPPSSVKKEVISDESDDDDIRVLETPLTACDQQTKPHKLTPEEANVKC